MDLILKNKYKITLTAESVSLKDSIDAIAYTLSLNITKNDKLVEIGLSKGDSLELYDYGYLSSEKVRIFTGIIWSTSTSDKTRKIQITAKERTVYIEESEDEWLFYEGQTADERAKLLCDEWNIPIGAFASTSIGLAKNRKKKSIYSMMLEDLKETSQKGGRLYKYRMGNVLDLIEIGTNSQVYELDSIIDEPSRKSSLDGAVTQVKVLGKNENDDTKSPIIGVYKQNTENYGTIQKIVQDEKVNDYASGQNKANSIFSTGEDTWTFKCVQDIPDIRAGDKVKLSGNFYYVTEITHNLGDGGGTMSMNTMLKLDDIRGKFYV